jgi:hypothetical protein
VPLCIRAFEKRYKLNLRDEAKKLERQYLGQETFLEWAETA